MTEQIPETKQDTLMNDLLNNPFDTVNAPSLTENQQPTVNKPVIDKLQPAQQVQAKQLATQINVTDHQAVLNYGASAQQKLGAFSQTMLAKVQSQDTGEIGDALSQLMYRLNEANPDDLRAEDRNLFKRMFGKIKQSIYEVTAKYQQIGAQIDNIATKLDQEKNGLIRDNEVLEELYAQNKAYFDALNIYIAAAQLKIKELETTIIPKAMAKADQADNQMVVQEVNDINQFKNRLEKRTYDLELARQIALQQAPQIRLIQNTNQVLAEKIQASINTAIPLWKNQVAIALTLLRQKDAVTAQRQVSQTTNDLLQKNSQLLKQSSIETAHENERGVVDIETLQKTQNDLVETLKETLSIQQEGRQKRLVAQKELDVMENQLRDHLLEFTKNSQKN